MVARLYITGTNKGVEWDQMEWDRIEQNHPKSFSKDELFSKYY